MNLDAIHQARYERSKQVLANLANGITPIVTDEDIPGWKKLEQRHLYIKDSLVRGTQAFEEAHGRA